jgi:hypothetical protein
MAVPKIRQIESKCFADYCSRRYRTLKELASAHGLKESALSRHIARKGWVARRAELESKVVNDPDNAVKAVQVEVVQGDRPPEDLVAARRIELRQRQASVVDDSLAKQVLEVAKRAEDEVPKMPIGAAVALLQGLSSLKQSVFPSTEDRGSHGRSVAILIGFSPTGE